MCGICGFVSKREISLDKLKEMNDTMYHRGPDDSGEEIYEISGVIGPGLPKGGFLLWICRHWAISRCIRTTGGLA